MILAQHCRNCHYILLHAFKFRNNQVSGIFFVSKVNLFLRQTSHTGDFSVEIIRMRRTITGNTSSGLCPARCIGRMGMYNSTYFRKRLIQLQMGRCIGGWLIPSFQIFISYFNRPFPWKARQQSQVLIAFPRNPYAHPISLCPKKFP